MERKVVVIGGMGNVGSGIVAALVEGGLENGGDLGNRGSYRQDSTLGKKNAERVRGEWRGWRELGAGGKVVVSGRILDKEKTEQRLAGGRCFTE